MPQKSMPPEVERFVQEYVQSVVQLEALLFLHARADQNFSVEALAARLYTSAADMVCALNGLRENGFLEEREGRFSYAPRAAHREHVDMLDFAYSRHLVEITRTIHGKIASAHST
jgi:hypothetical protein